MADRFTNRPGFLAVTVGGLLMTGQLVTAPPAQGCPAGQVEDTVTRMCWSQSGRAIPTEALAAARACRADWATARARCKTPPCARGTESRGAVRLRARKAVTHAAIGLPS